MKAGGKGKNGQKPSENSSAVFHNDSRVLLFTTRYTHVDAESRKESSGNLGQIPDTNSSAPVSFK
jgi:hypothetical protein